MASSNPKPLKVGGNVGPLHVTESSHHTISRWSLLLNRNTHHASYYLFKDKIVLYWNEIGLHFD